ncbi:MAG: hypothetical protein PHS60_06475 [Zavarzinia sp.]|nr:hypothetical protein [Zavarzinia sp.]
MGDYSSLCGKDLSTGRSVACELYRIGAHDGHGGGTGAGRPRPSQPRPSHQLTSWFSPNSGIESRGHQLIGQIYFGHDDRALDKTNDMPVLEALAKWMADFRLKGNPGCQLWFNGYADPSGAASYNERLSLKRAQMVKSYVDKAMKRNAPVLSGLFYGSTANGFGELYPSGDKGTDRRVDILDVTPGVTPDRSVSLPPVIVNMARPGQWASGTLQFRMHLSLSVDVVVAGVQNAFIEVRNPRSGRSAFYEFLGPSLGFSALPGSVSADSGYTDYTFPPGFMDIDSFEGPGLIIGAAAIKGATLCHFFGASTEKLKLVTQSNQAGFTYISTGVGVDVGISGSAGYWKKLNHIANAQELRRYIESREKGSKR